MTPGLLPIALGLATALTWGAGDFSGGLASKRTRPLHVVIVAHVFSMTLLLAAVLVLRPPAPPLRAWLWGGLAGLIGPAGLVLLYQALASGRMSVAAPVSGVVGAAIPVVFGAFTQGLPSFWVLTGFGLAMVSIWLVSEGGSAHFRLADLRLPVLAGLTFGVFFIALHLAGDGSVLYSLIAVRIASISSLWLFTRLLRQPVTVARETWPLVLMSGLLDTAGNAAYALAAQTGRVDMAAVLGSLYPGVTVLLAWTVLKERVNPQQLAGIAAALAAIVLITV